MGTEARGHRASKKMKLASDFKRDEVAPKAATGRQCPEELPAAEAVLKIRREGLRQRRQPPPPAMGTEARGHRASKKMKLASDSKRHEAAPTVPPKPRSMEAPPAGAGADGDEGDVDRISALPDELIGEIVWLLPTKQGARTAILSSRWRHLWRKAPLNLDCRGLDAGDVSAILSSHKAPGRRLCVDASHYILRAPDLDSLLNAWFLSPTLNELQELEFWFKPYFPPPPSSTFRFSATLRVVTIGYCNLREGTIQGLHFPLLKQLGLDSVSISECSLHNMIAGCPILECLLINLCYGFRCLRVNSLSLRSIAVRNGFTEQVVFEELVIESAPRLESLLHLDWYSDRDLQVSLLSVPKLETLIFTRFTTLVFGYTMIQGLRVDGPTRVCTLKSLALAAPYKNISLDMVIEFLRCFPCLEKLYIWGTVGKLKRQNYAGNQLLMECHDLRLKNLVVQDYRGRNSEVDIINFLLLNASALESITLVVCEGKEFVAKQRSKIQLENRASSGAQLRFTSRTGHKFGDIKYFHHLDLIDPWEDGVQEYLVW